MCFFERDRTISGLMIFVLICVALLLSACLGKPASTNAQSTTDALTTTDNSGSVNSTDSEELFVSPFDVVTTEDQATQIAPANTLTPAPPPTATNSDDGSYLRITGAISSSMFEGRFTVGNTLADANHSPRLDDGNRADLVLGQCVEVRGNAAYEYDRVVLIASRIKFLDDYCD